MLRLEHSAILLTFIKLPFDIKLFVFFFEWPFYTGFTELVFGNSEVKDQLISDEAS